MFILYLWLTIFLVPILIAMILVQIVQKISFCSGSQCLQQFILKRKCNITLLLETRNYISLLINSQYLSPPSSPLQKKQSKTKNDIQCIYLFIKNIWWKFKTKSCHQVMHSIFKHHALFSVKIFVGLYD